MGHWEAWFALLLLFIVLLGVKEWLGRHLQGVALLFSGNDDVALVIYYMILLPGVLLHELSHAVAALLVGVRTRRISLLPQAHRGGAVSLGTVHVEASDSLRESWIGVAPLLTGSLAIVLVGRWRLGIAELSLLQPRLLLGTLWSLLHISDTWLWLYLIFAISNAMMPSEADRRSWLPVLAFCGAGAVLLYVTGTLDELARLLGRWPLHALTYLTLAFGLALGVDVLFGGAVLLLEKAGEALLGRHVEYP